MSDNNQFDEFFRNRLLDHSSPVDKGTWKKIHSQLGRVKAFHFWKWYVAGPVVVVVAVIAAHFILSPVKTPVAGIAKATSATSPAANTASTRVPSSNSSAATASSSTSAASPAANPATATSPSSTRSVTTSPSSAATTPLLRGHHLIRTCHHPVCVCHHPVIRAWHLSIRTWHLIRVCHLIRTCHLPIRSNPTCRFFRNRKPGSARFQYYPFAPTQRFPPNPSP